MSPGHHNLRASAIMVFAVATFSLMDAGLKVLSAAYPALQVAAIRSLASLPLVLAWIGFRGGFRPLLQVRLGLQLLRGALGIVMLTGFVYGVAHLPLSEAYTIFFVAPLLITVFAVPLLGERVDGHRWAAIAVGMAGVLIALRPTGAGVALLPALAVLGASACYALSAVLVRILGRTDSTQSMMFWLMASIAAGAGLLALPDWRPIRPEHWIVIAGVAVAGSIGQWGLTEAFRTGESSFIAPFEYTALGWGLLLDWLVWHALPGPTALLGAAVIVASGIYVLRRERQVVDPLP